MVKSRLAGLNYLTISVLNRKCSGKVHNTSPSAFQDTIKLPGAIDLVPHFSAALSTPVFIPVSIWEDQEKELVDRHGTAAFRAVKFGGLQFFKIFPALHRPRGDRRCEIERIVFHG